jgi:hypothetical protein
MISKLFLFVVAISFFTLSPFAKAESAPVKVRANDLYATVGPSVADHRVIACAKAVYNVAITLMRNKGTAEEKENLQGATYFNVISGFRDSEPTNSEVDLENDYALNTPNKLSREQIHFNVRGIVGHKSVHGEIGIAYETLDQEDLVTNCWPLEKKGLRNEEVDLNLVYDQEPNTSLLNFSPLTGFDDIP